MTSFPALGAPVPGLSGLSGSGLPPSGLPGAAFWRALLALLVVLVLLATTGWSAVRHAPDRPGPYAASLLAWQKGRLDGRRLPRADAPPGALARFFHRLGTAQRLALAARYPLVVGNLDGAPPALRYRANRIALRHASAVERRRTTDAGLTDDGRRTAAQRLRRLSSLLRPGRHVLAFDPTGRGQVAEVFGDLAAARRVSVVVPGVDTDLLSYEKADKPYAAPAGMARALQDRQHADAPTRPTATIAWADYDSPRGLGVAAATNGLAQRGSRRLTRFVRGLPGSTPVALFCHSYGSVVCGDAAGEVPARVTDIAVAGSPGMRVDRARRLGTRARVWAARDDGDWIADVPHVEVAGLGHGADPVSAGFGARRVSAAGAEGHAGYFAPGTSSLANFADIGTGAYTAVSCAPGDPGCGRRSHTAAAAPRDGAGDGDGRAGRDGGGGEGRRGGGDADGTGPRARAAGAPD